MFEHRAAQGSAKRFEPVQVTGLLITSWVIMGATRWLAVLLDCDGIERAPAVPQAKAKPRVPGDVQQTRLCPVGEGRSSSRAARATPHYKVGLAPMGQVARTPDIGVPTDHNEHCSPK